MRARIEFEREGSLLSISFFILEHGIHNGPKWQWIHEFSLCFLAGNKGQAPAPHLRNEFCASCSISPSFFFVFSEELRRQMRNDNINANDFI